ncbi:hypothetical protein D8Y22_11565 [Salinadaptatus halalkaliphilus]|uniref:DUF7965 domain-containing protein n=1 Tax=Salinadaptatus halalkaliphilus TaxID=2419781 RepID=A0A4S3TMA3_9EURY|nr:hypothetical protein [Salinadaptatus halalkaliphilus]THE64740.1 hypothetical protein D8Y22_11565 [Salinadaptatus halalkaliphilus]
MVDRRLETIAVGTATLVICVVGLSLGGHVTGQLATTLQELGTIPSAVLFGYLWLLVVVVASQFRVLDPATKRPVVALGDAAGAGIVISIIYLTVVLVIGFVAPVSAVLDPATLPVFRAALAGIGIGAVLGVLFGLFFVGCKWIATTLVVRTTQ